MNYNSRNVLKYLNFW